MLPDTSSTITTSFGPLEAATYHGRIRGSSSSIHSIPFHSIRRKINTIISECEEEHAKERHLHSNPLKTMQNTPSNNTTKSQTTKAMLDHHCLLPRAGRKARGAASTSRQPHVRTYRCSLPIMFHVLLYVPPPLNQTTKRKPRLLHSKNEMLTFSAGGLGDAREIPENSGPRAEVAKIRCRLFREARHSREAKTTSRDGSIPDGSCSADSFCGQRACKWRKAPV